jgi:hypothetical protein
MECIHKPMMFQTRPQSAAPSTCDSQPVNASSARSGRTRHMEKPEGVADVSRTRNTVLHDLLQIARTARKVRDLDYRRLDVGVSGV